MRAPGLETNSGQAEHSMEWLSQEVFEETEYGRLNKQPGAENFIPQYQHYEIPLGGRVVADPKDGTYGIVVDREGKVVSKVVLNP